MRGTTRVMNTTKTNQITTILHYFGDAGIIIGVTMLLPIIVALIYNENNLITPFLTVGIITILVSTAIKLIFKNKTKMTLRLSMFFVMFIWLYLALMGSLPYIITGQLSITNAYFEAMSGFTTTGFTMFTNFNHIPYTINFWRALTQWLGGLGLIFMVVTFMRTMGKDTVALYHAEGREERIFPSIKHTSKKILTIYLGFTLAGIILFILVGMPIFDSIFYTFTAISSGGFAMASNSLLHYNSFLIELVAMFLMIVAATNFNLIYSVLNGNWKEYFRDSETKVFLTITISAVFFVGLILTMHHAYGASIFENYRFALFQVVSAITTTGLQTSFSPDFNTHYYTVGTLILIIVMLVGGGTCSTGGGIKWQRINILAHSIEDEIINLLQPSNAVVVSKYHHFKDIKITDKAVKYTLTFISIYLLMFMISVLIISVFYNNLPAVLFEVASAMANVGLGDAIVGASSPLIIKIVFIVDFWLGRLEIWPILIVLYHIAKKVKKSSVKKIKN